MLYMHNTYYIYTHCSVVHCMYFDLPVHMHMHTHITNIHCIMCIYSVLTH